MAVLPLRHVSQRRVDTYQGTLDSDLKRYSRRRKSGNRDRAIWTNIGDDEIDRTRSKRVQQHGQQRFAELTTCRFYHARAVSSNAPDALTRARDARLAKVDLDALLIVIHVDHKRLGAVAVPPHGADELGRGIEVLGCLLVHIATCKAYAPPGQR